jgi:soluble lytic murein transglycosylase-like protein
MKLSLVALAGLSVAGLSALPAQAAKHHRHHAALRAHVSPGVGAIRQLIAKHAAANGVPFELADAVVRIESTYKPHVSNAGALGLMQIKPSTARGLGFSGASGDLYSAETNIRFGMKYLAQVYRKSGGDVCGTVMRYQSGAYATHMNGANRAYCAKARSIMASR